VKDPESVGVVDRAVLPLVEDGGERSTQKTNTLVDDPDLVLQNRSPDGVGRVGGELYALRDMEGLPSCSPVHTTEIFATTGP
jgi:hypothetical protein